MYEYNAKNYDEEFLIIAASPVERVITVIFQSGSRKDKDRCRIRKKMYIHWGYMCDDLLVIIHGMAQHADGKDSVLFFKL